ncbi:class I SAM-dependent methyltransferase [Enterococcus hirae]|uniref:class I SAM-dependent methyltransferase n=1 Tax=Enterococcus TaxID=1350 RepID=UPI0003303E6C|nr:class I SAM-dependent methyltransferase [Enterococcus hirae]OWW46080.1 methyltransferase [Enterococcus hirae 81-15-F4]OWW59995.1 methyltransferase [Enterococcus hirae 88-15-E09]EMF0051699.1 class I SAM-dependent methyltransferase [Enterococcus hirae]EMF0082250.1 class I SAM-dependent methyltransferase [Enterococcus hirae]EMF0093806.1 class I SAM-dependent methyltransferase [Enterococcus hirae]
MTNHYYSQEPTTEHDFEQWSFELKGKNFQFVTDSGVFSRETVDFGSRVLIDTFNWEELPVDGKILDVGCGYGPIGLAIAFASQRFVEMVDINSRAVELAQGNANRNGIKQVDIHQSNIYEAVHEETYAAIVSNPPIRAGKKVVHEILTEAYPRLKSGGTLTIVIQKKQGAPSAKSKMAETFGNAEIVHKEKGYYIIKSIKE